MKADSTGVSGTDLLKAVMLRPVRLPRDFTFWTVLSKFGKGGFLRGYEKWFYNSKILKTTSCYTYLGRLFTPMVPLKSAKIKLVSQSEKAIISISKYQRKYGHLLLNETFKLFNAIVKPILRYASRIWGTEQCEIIEPVQSAFCKIFLGVNSSVNNTIWRLEIVGDYLSGLPITLLVSNIGVNLFLWRNIDTRHSVMKC